MSDRLKDMIARHDWLIGDVIPKNVHRWVMKATLARNFRAHHDPTAQPVGTEADELVGLAARLTVLLEACLLAEAGFAEDEVAKMVRRASPAYRMLHLNPGI